MSTEELIRKEVENLPEDLQREVYDFARFLRVIIYTVAKVKTSKLEEVRVKIRQLFS